MLGSFGQRLSRLTTRDLGRLGVEVHTGAMVVGMDEDCVAVQLQADGRTERFASRTKVWAAGMTASPLGRMLAGAGGAETDRMGRVKVAPDCSLPGHPEVFVVGDLMALDDLPGMAEVAMQSGRHAAETIVRRNKGDAAVRVRSATTTSARWPPSRASGRWPCSGPCASAGSSVGCCGWWST